MGVVSGYLILTEQGKMTDVAVEQNNWTRGIAIRVHRGTNDHFSRARTSLSTVGTLQRSLYQRQDHYKDQYKREALTSALSHKVVNRHHHLHPSHALHRYQRDGNIPIFRIFRIGVATALCNVSRLRHQCCHKHNRQCPRNHDNPVARADEQCVFEQRYGELKKPLQQIREPESVLPRRVEVPILSF